MTEIWAPAIGASIELPWYKQQLGRLKSFLIRARRRLPYLVWWNDELDVTVTFSQDKLPVIEMHPSDDPAKAFKPLFSGAFADIERNLRELGIEFDKGMGFGGRDWEWDWSLKGPISVRFRGRASRPHLRMEKQKPKLVVSNAS